MGIGSIIGGGLGLIGSLVGGNASQSAANTQANAANNATAAQLQMFNTTQANLQPWVTAGGNALQVLMAQLGITPGTPASPATGPTGGTPPSSSGEGGGFTGNPFDMPGAPTGMPGAPGTSGTPATPASFNPNASLVKPFTAADFTASPGYQWQLSQGLGAVNNAASVTGPGGNTLKDLMTYGEGLASQDWWNAYNAYTNNQSRVFNMLQTLSAGGANAGANLGGFASQVGGQIGSNIIGAGNAMAAGRIGQANAFAGGANSVGNAFLLRNLMAGGGYGGGYGVFNPAGNARQTVQGGYYGTG